MMALVSSLDLTIWMPLYVTCKTFITPLMIPFTSFAIGGVNVTGSPHRKKCDANGRGPSSMIMVCWLYQTSLLLKCKYTLVSTLLFFTKPRSAHNVSIPSCILRSVVSTWCSSTNIFKYTVYIFAYKEMYILQQC